MERLHASFPYVWLALCSVPLLGPPPQIHSHPDSQDTDSANKVGLAEMTFHSAHVHILKGDGFGDDSGM